MLFLLIFHPVSPSVHLAYSRFLYASSTIATNTAESNFSCSNLTCSAFDTTGHNTMFKIFLGTGIDNNNGNHGNQAACHQYIVFRTILPV